jgi:hypothetical protein
MPINVPLFQWTSTIKIQLSVLGWYKADLIIISLKIILFSPRYSWKIAELALNVQQSFTPLYRLSFNLWFMITPLVLTPFLQARHYYWVHYQPQEEAEGVITTFHPLYIMNAWISVGTLLCVYDIFFSWYLNTWKLTSWTASQSAFLWAQTVRFFIWIIIHAWASREKEKNNTNINKNSENLHIFDFA